MLHCTDSRDKVYGVLGLLPPGLSRQLVPDYSKPAEEVYREAFLAHLRHFRRWEIIGCEWDQRRTTAPSWVPDFSAQPAAVLDSRSQMSSGYSKVEISIPVAEGVLGVLGVQCATVTEVGRPIPRTATMENITEVRRSWLRMLSGRESAPYITGGTVLDAYVRTLSQGWIEDRWLYFEYAPPIQVWRRIFGEGEQRADLGGSLATDIKLEYVRETCSGRSFAIFSEGYVGLVPHCVTAGKSLYHNPSMESALSG